MDRQVCRKPPVSKQNQSSRGRESAAAPSRARKPGWSSVALSVSCDGGGVPRLQRIDSKILVAILVRSHRVSRGRQVRDRERSVGIGHSDERTKAVGPNERFDQCAGSGVPATQSKTTPESRVRGIVLPVEKKVEAPVFLIFPRRSVRPGIIEHGVRRIRRASRAAASRRSHRDAMTFLALRRAERSERGPRATWRACGRSLTTSSKRKITSFGETPTLPESGMIATICGAAASGGPPGGMPGEAHPTQSSAAAVTRRKAPSLFRRAARAA